MDEAAAATVVAMLSPNKRGRPADGAGRQRPSKYRKSEDVSSELYSNKGMQRRNALIHYAPRDSDD
jgi:hypothetical protein